VLYVAVIYTELALIGIVVFSPELELKVVFGDVVGYP